MTRSQWKDHEGMYRGAIAYEKNDLQLARNEDPSITDRPKPQTQFALTIRTTGAGVKVPFQTDHTKKTKVNQDRLILSGMRHGYPLGCRNTEITTDFANKEFIDFAVPGNCGHLRVRDVHVDRMVAALSQEFAVVIKQVPNQLSAFHGVDISNGSRETSWPAMDRSASSRLASSTI